MRAGMIGQICGALGLMLLLVSPLVFLGLGPTVAGAHAIVGVAAIVVYFASNYGRLGQFASS